MTIQEILEDHLRVKGVRGLETLCICGWHTAQRLRPEDLHRSHLAEVLDKHMQEREAAVIAGLAELMDEYRSNHDIAECAGYVEGETGRQACIDKWEAITEEPAEWLRKKAAEHSTQGFEYLRYIAYEAWYAGKESAPGEENPYADKDTPEES